MATKCVFIYARISEDKGGRAEGVAAQQKWGNEYAAEHWPGVPVRVFADNDLSAAKEDVYRPEFEAMREAIRRGECAQIWAVEQNRLTRLESVWFSLAADLLQSDVNEVHTKRNGVIDVGGVVAGIMAVLGAHEVKQLRKRVRDKMAELASQGRPAAGANFGYRKRIYTAAEQQRLDRWRESRSEARAAGEDMRRWKEENPRPLGGRRVLDEQGRASMEIVPEQAAIIREAATRVLDGWTVYQVADDLRSRGIRSTNGGVVAGNVVQRWLESPTTAGLRVYHGEIIRKAEWEPILDESTWRAVRAALPQPSRPAPRKPRRFLLTRLVRCTACDGRPMLGTSRVTYHRYVCNGSDGRGGCGSAISGLPVDRYVVKELFDHLAGLHIAAAPDEHSERREEIVIEMRALDASRAEWLKARDAGQLDLGEFLEAKAKFDEGQKRLNVELAGLPAPIERIDPAELREDWPELPLHRRRQVLDDYVRAVMVRPVDHETPTMATVAKALGVSKTTVWRAFLPSGHPERRLPPSTEEKIIKAAAGVGYQHGAESQKALDPTTRVEIFWR